MNSADVEGEENLPKNAGKKKKKFQTDAITNQKQLTLNCSNITVLREIKIPGFKKGRGVEKVSGNL